MGGAAIRRRAFLGLLAGAVPAVALAQPSPPLLVKAGRLLDVRTGRAQAKAALLIVGDRIREIGAEATVAAHAPPGTTVLDLGEFTVLPGLIDAHTHLTYGLNIAGYEALGISVPREALIGAKNARLTLMSGFTTVRNLGARGYADIALRDSINEGELPGPRILASGPAIGSTGGHMDCGLLAPEFNYRAEGVADGRDAVIRKTREVIKYGADVVKVAVTGGILSKGTIPSAGQYSDEELRAIVEEAHRLRRRVAAHAHGAEGVLQAVRAGVDSIEHGSLIDDAGIRLMKSRGTYLVPTLYASEWLVKNGNPPLVPRDMLEKARELLPVARSHISRALRSGVKVAFEFAHASWSDDDVQAVLEHEAHHQVVEEEVREVVLPLGPEHRLVFAQRPQLLDEDEHQRGPEQVQDQKVEPEVRRVVREVRDGRGGAAEQLRHHQDQEGPGREPARAPEDAVHDGDGPGDDHAARHQVAQRGHVVDRAELRRAGLGLFRGLGHGALQQQAHAEGEQDQRQQGDEAEDADADMGAAPADAGVEVEVGATLGVVEPTALAAGDDRRSDSGAVSGEEEGDKNACLRIVEVEGRQEHLLAEILRRVDAGHEQEALISILAKPVIGHREAFGVEGKTVHVVHRGPGVDLFVQVKWVT